MKNVSKCCNTAKQSYVSNLKRYKIDTHLLENSIKYYWEVYDIQGKLGRERKYTLSKKQLKRWLDHYESNES